MRAKARFVVIILIWVAAGLLVLQTRGTRAQTVESGPSIVGRVLDTQDQAVVDAEMVVYGPAGDQPIGAATSQPDGSFQINLSNPIPDELRLAIDRPHFHADNQILGAEVVQLLQQGSTVTLRTVTLVRKTSLGFWVSILVFTAMLVLIASGRIHNTLAALAGAVALMGVSYLGSPISGEIYIFDFERALDYVDWNVIFLIMGMMILIAVVERTGIFQWLAFFAYKLSQGRNWVLMVILMIITGVASALLDNVTTMLLMTPITIQIALALNINPLALLMPEVMASNIAGISTLIGTPTNILIGSYADISFNDFLTNLTPGVVLSFTALTLYSLWIYRTEIQTSSEMSTLLEEKLAERAHITEPDQLRKAGWVGAGMLLLFIVGERFHLIPAVTALIGATALLLWIRPDIEEMLQAVDWTTLVFFISLFMVVGAIQEVGFISKIADLIGQLVGNNLAMGMIAITLLSAVLSTVIANIPFTAAMLPVVGFLTTSIPGAESLVLFYCLSIGSAMGGNGSLIGASANMVVSGISERAGFPITYSYFLKKGVPIMLVTVVLALAWLFIHFS